MTGSSRPSSGRSRSQRRSGLRLYAMLRMTFGFGIGRFRPARRVSRLLGQSSQLCGTSVLVSGPLSRLCVSVRLGQSSQLRVLMRLGRSSQLRVFCGEIGGVDGISIFF